MWGDVGRCGEMWGDVGRCGEMWDGTCPPALGEIWGDVPRDGEICRDVSTCVKTCRRRSFSQFIRELTHCPLCVKTYPPQLFFQLSHQLSTQSALHLREDVPPAVLEERDEDGEQVEQREELCAYVWRSQGGMTTTGRDG